jgi:hypothetical protein
MRRGPRRQNRCEPILGKGRLGHEADAAGARLPLCDFQTPGAGPEPGIEEVGFEEDELRGTVAVEGAGDGALWAMGGWRVAGEWGGGEVGFGRGVG